MFKSNVLLPLHRNFKNLQKNEKSLERRIKNDYPKSIYYLEKAHVSNPSSSWPLADIGVIHLEIKNYNLFLAKNKVAEFK